MTPPALNCEVRTVVSRLTREEESELGVEGQLDAAQPLGLEFGRIAIGAKSSAARRFSLQRSWCETE